MGGYDQTPPKKKSPALRRWLFIISLLLFLLSISHPGVRIAPELKGDEPVCADGCISE